jgi:hypothetical protein
MQIVVDKKIGEGMKVIRVRRKSIGERMKVIGDRGQERRVGMLTNYHIIWSKLIDW